jgi:hypothetical protein
MISNFTSFSGINNFKKVTVEIDPTRQQHHFNIELLDVDYDPNMSLADVYYEHLSSRPSDEVEVLYSGGIDSEIILAVCLAHKIRCRAMTLRLLIKGVAVNTHDLYYAERFTRQNNIPHTIVDLNVDKFYNNGEHLQYLEPYLNKEFHVSTHMWLIEQCSKFPIIGGFYPWPWTHGPKVFSPMRNTYNLYDKFMQDRSITGIGNMQSHSLTSVLLFVQAHLKCIQKYSNLKGVDMTHFRSDINKTLGLDLEPRLRTYGWDSVDKDVFDKDSINRELISRFGPWKNSITWNKTLADAIAGQPGTWDRFD